MANTVKNFFTSPKLDFYVDKHEKYIKRCLDVLPSKAAHLDETKLMAVYFCVSALDLINRPMPEALCQELIEAIYALQICDVEKNMAGFRGSTSFKYCGIYDGHQLGMTYTGLATLIILGDDLSRVKRAEIARFLGSFQQEDGSFVSYAFGSESDMRFVYCAAAVAFILDDFSGFDVDKTVEFIKSCIRYDGGISMRPGTEAHGGSTFCALASLVLLGRVSQVLDAPWSEIRTRGLVNGAAQLPAARPDNGITVRDKMLRWCVSLMNGGFSGRPNKPPDTCYSFWVGGALDLLGGSDLTDSDEISRFILFNQSAIIGGIAKAADCDVDVLHTYMGLAGLSLIGMRNPIRDLGIVPLNAALNVSQRAYERLLRIHEQWRSTK